MRDTCETCGRKPVQMVRSTRHLGPIITGRSWQTTGLLCREHGEKQLKADLIFSLLLGWWGILDIIINTRVVSSQLTAMKKLSQLAPPHVVAIAEGPITSAPAAPDAET
jgi:hypothetical protein